MSKSIYHEALEIIDKNTFELGKGLDVLKPTYRDTVVKALEQAQKQEKLLNKVKEIIDRHYNFHDDERSIMLYRYKEIENNIRELENEK